MRLIFQSVLCVNNFNGITQAANARFTVTDFWVKGDAVKLCFHCLTRLIHQY